MGRMGERNEGGGEYLECTMWENVFSLIHVCCFIYKKWIPGNMKEEESMIATVLTYGKNIAC